MSGFSSVQGLETIVSADNASFDGTARDGAMTTNGELFIGSTSAPHVKKGTLTSPLGTVTVGYDSPNITLDVSGSAVGQTITGDSGGALSPTAGNWNIFGGPGVTTSGSGSTLTINSVVFTNRSTSATVTRNSGSFCTAAGVTLTLPAAPAQGELLEFSCTTADTLIIDAPSTHLIRIGSLVSSAGGTATSTQIGDSLVLRYHAASTTWIATSVIGTWILA